MTTVVGAATVMVAAPIVLAGLAIIKIAWPVIPLLTVGLLMKNVGTSNTTSNERNSSSMGKRSG